MKKLILTVGIAALFAGTSVMADHHKDITKHENVAVEFYEDGEDMCIGANLHYDKKTGVVTGILTTCVGSDVTPSIVGDLVFKKKTGKSLVFAVGKGSGDAHSDDLNNPQCYYVVMDVKPQKFHAQSCDMSQDYVGTYTFTKIDD